MALTYFWRVLSAKTEPQKFFTKTLKNERAWFLQAKCCSIFKVPCRSAHRARNSLFIIPRRNFLVNTFFTIFLKKDGEEWKAPVERITPTFAVGLPWKKTSLLTDLSGADDGNRTRVTSLGSWNSAIELHPHRQC